MAFLELQHLTKRFGSVSAVDGVSLEIRSGEFFCIVGPSGCGKTTVLRMIAGFERPTEGLILLNGRDTTSDPPQRRSVGMVFQNYALFPHMTVYENVAFGLEAQSIPRPAIDTRVRKILDTVGLRERARSPVQQLSGGEQQRIAVARALVVEPAVLLMDEPLSNLDVALRLKTRGEIRSLQRKSGITTVYVTHDQSEAMSLSDRIAVMRGGRVEQVGTPAEIYESPASPFVAEFLGSANILPVSLLPGGTALAADSLRIPIPATFVLPAGSDFLLAVKPEGVAVLVPPCSDGCAAVVEATEYLGFTTTIFLRSGERSLKASVVSNEASRRLKQGMQIFFSLDWSKCTLFPLVAP